MSVNQNIWSIDSGFAPLNESRLNSEGELEDLIEARPEILSPDLLIIGRQVLTQNSGKVDLLGIDAEGSLVLIELKRDRTPRDVVAQTLDYASWVVTLGADDVASIYKNYHKSDPQASLKREFKEYFKRDLEDENVNSSHKMIIVASEMDSSTERILGYLNRYEIPLNIAFFRVFEHDGKRLLSRAWLLDPEETQASPTPPSEKVPWNGEFYCSFGHDDNRNWEEARKYGFISAGGGAWYTRTLHMLGVGDRVWVNIPHTGYVGVGLVTEPAQLAKDALFSEHGDKTIYELEPNGLYHADRKNDPEMAEYLVRVHWLKTVPISDAVSEVGLFGNQNTICRPTAERWLHTISLLSERWGI